MNTAQRMKAILTIILRKMTYRTRSWDKVGEIDNVVGPGVYISYIDILCCYNMACQEHRILWLPRIWQRRTCRFRVLRKIFESKHLWGPSLVLVKILDYQRDSSQLIVSENAEYILDTRWDAIHFTKVWRSLNEWFKRPSSRRYFCMNRRHIGIYKSCNCDATNGSYW